MKKYLILFSSFIALSPTFVFAQDNNEKINVLLEEIAILEKEVEEKKLEVQKLAYGEKENEIEWIELNMNVTGGYYKDTQLVTLQKIGIDYSKVTPEFVAFYHMKSIGSEKESVRSHRLEGSLQVETEEALDWAEYAGSQYFVKDGDDYIEADEYDLPAKVAPGFESYWERRYKISSPEGEYYFTDYLGGGNWKIAVYNTREEFGTVLPGQW